MDIISMAEIEARYQSGEGRHWFDASSKRFFKCRLAQVGYEGKDGAVYFVSSEQNSGWGHSHPRLYSERDRVFLIAIDELRPLQRPLLTLEG